MMYVYKKKKDISTKKWSFLNYFSQIFEKTNVNVLNSPRGQKLAINPVRQKI